VHLLPNDSNAIGCGYATANVQAFNPQGKKELNNLHYTKP